MDKGEEQGEATFSFSTEPGQIFDGGFLEGLINGRGSAGTQEARQPVVGVREEPEWFVVHAELPGIDPRDVDVKAAEGWLTLVEGRRGAPAQHDGGSGLFLRTLALPENADAGAMLTIRQDTTLDVLIPKSVQARAAVPPR